MMSDTLDYLLEPIDHWLNDPAVEDVCLQEPGAAWVFTQGHYIRYPVNLDATAIDDLAIVAGAQRERDFNESNPILGIDLVGRNGRLHAIGKPCIESCTAITIRRGSSEWPTIEELVSQGLFRNVTRGKRARTKIDDELSALYRNATTDEQWGEFLTLATQVGKTIVIAGENATGKTHVSKALISKIPLDVRLIVIENARELKGLPHPNCVQMYYAKDDEDGIKPTTLVDAALRMRIGRLFLQEIRDGWETMAFLLAAQTGHRGAITTIHASSCKGVFDRMMGTIKMTTAGAAWKDEVIMAQLHELIDIVVHTSRLEGSFAVDEVLYNEAIGE